MRTLAAIIALGARRNGSAKRSGVFVGRVAVPRPSDRLRQQRHDARLWIGAVSGMAV